MDNINMQPTNLGGEDPFRQSQPDNALTAPKTGRFKASLIIAKESWRLLKQDKEMMAFPILSAITSIIVLGIAGTLFYLAVLGGNLENIEGGGDISYLAEIAFVFLMYFLTTFVTIFFQAGIITIVRGRLRNQNLSFSDGMKNSFSKFGKIVLWSLVSATIGTILKLISERSKLLGKIVVMILGAAWSILTFFIAPILIAEDLPIKESLKKSAAVIRKVWGESVIVNVGAGLFFGMLFFLGMIVFIVTLFTMNSTVIITAAIALFVYLIVIVIISSTLDVIFKVVLYEYASSGMVPPGFSPEVLRMAFKESKQTKGIIGIGGM